MIKCNIQNRSIYCHDNLEVLQGINSNCIDLIYLDPPFNKKKVFTAPIGSSAEGASFKDIFNKEDIKDEWILTIKEDHIELYNFLSSIKNINNSKYYLYNYCYLAYMAIRLIECHRILKDTGSLYLHCDPTMSHYLKMLLDCIFDERNFRNEIIWYYTNKIPDKRKKLFTKSNDIILFYCKNTDRQIFNLQEEKRKKPQKVTKIKKVEGKKIYVRGKDGKVITFMRDMRVVDNIWNFPLLHSQKEYIGYPTQKPLVLLARIIKASSNETDMVLDPFCGCATTCIAAERLKRQWIGIDVSVKAYELVKRRLPREIEQKDTLFYEELINFQTNPPQRTDKEKINIQEKKYVYVISNPKYENEYKVGIAKDYKTRLNSYQTSDPDRSYQLEYKVYTSLFRELEKHIHNTFENKHEWVRGNLEEIINEMNRFIEE